jgi:hypothetical protein
MSPDPMKYPVSGYSQLSPGKSAIVSETLSRREIKVSNGKYKFNHPVYTKYLGLKYPKKYNQIYGKGPRQDHYYYGLTPKDIILSNPLVIPRKSEDLVLFQDIQLNRNVLDTLNSLFSKCLLPTNNELLSTLTEIEKAVDSQMNYFSDEPNIIHEETRHLLCKFQNFLVVVRKMITEKNGNQILQKFVHHSLLAKSANNGVQRQMGSPYKENTSLRTDDEKVSALSVLKVLIFDGGFIDFIRKILHFLQDFIDIDDSAFISNGKAYKKKRTDLITASEYSLNDKEYRISAKRVKLVDNEISPERETNLKGLSDKVISIVKKALKLLEDVYETKTYRDALEYIITLLLNPNYLEGKILEDEANLREMYCDFTAVILKFARIIFSNY